MIRQPHSLAGLLVTLLLFLCTPSSAQEDRSIRWLTFEQLEDSLAVTPKYVFLDFYTDWCTYCRKMDKVVFTKPEVIDLLNEHYYAVRFNAETDSAVTFSGREFINDQLRTSRTPVHQLAQLLASRKGSFAPPTLVLLDKEFNVTARYFEYMNSTELVTALRAASGDQE